MRGVIYERFGELPEVRELPEPTPTTGGVVVRVAATGLCRSDWHGWLGHDPDIRLPHVPGHELAGTVELVGAGVTGWRPGDRVTVPFVCGCGTCPMCAAGAQQVCERQTQPGFTHWGSFAEYVALENADVNLVGIPDAMAFGTAASLGCRFATAFRAVVAQGRVAPGEWVAVHGCGGVGLSAIMIAVAAGARVVAVDIAQEPLDIAASLGAELCLDVSDGVSVAEQIRDMTQGGVHVSVDALGSQVTCAASINSLRRHGRHVQVGLRRHGRHVQVGLLPADPTLPMSRVISFELSLHGSHGMAAHAYPELLAMINTGTLRPDLLITNTISLDEAPAALAAMNTAGVTIIEPATA